MNVSVNVFECYIYFALLSFYLYGGRGRWVMKMKMRSEVACSVLQCYVLLSFYYYHISLDASSDINILSLMYNNVQLQRTQWQCCVWATSRSCFWLDLNSSQTKESVGWPIPSIKDMITKIGSKCAKWFAVLDLTSRYHQAPIDEKYTYTTQNIISPHSTNHWPGQRSRQPRLQFLLQLTR